jgi:hypothetical protein
MIECIFTIDYEIYGNGEGSLKELVYEPAQRLMEIFLKRDVRCVIFVEVAELEMIEKRGTDRAIDLVKQQVRNFRKEGFELGLHLHPQWYNASNEDGRWFLDNGEYNLCTLRKERIEQIVKQAIAYMRDLLGEPEFTPISFRAGNWLFQPTQPAAEVLASQGIKIDSSLFKGGLQHKHRLDYRRAPKKKDYWTFSDRVDVPDHEGALLELPIYTQMVPFWKMATSKRVGMQRKSVVPGAGKSGRLLHRLPDYLRFLYPLKLDFCRMTLDEIVCMFERIIRKDRLDPSTYIPVVAIGHTKDLVDFATVESFLNFLNHERIEIRTFEDVYYRCNY